MVKDGVDLSEFAALADPKRRKCTVGQALGALEGAEKLNLEAALAAPRDEINANAITKWCAMRGLGYVKYGFVNSHRAQNCSCYER